MVPSLLMLKSGEHQSMYNMLLVCLGNNVIVYSVYREISDIVVVVLDDHHLCRYFIENYTVGNDFEPFYLKQLQIIRRYAS